MNSLINGKVHNSVLPMVDGNYKLVLHDMQFEYTPDMLEKVFRKMEVIGKDEKIVFQKHTDFSSPLGSDAASSSSSTVAQ